MPIGDIYNPTFEDGEAAKRAMQQQWDAGNARRRGGVQDMMGQEAARQNQMDSTSLTRNLGPQNANDSWLGTVQERANVNAPWQDRAQQPTFGQPSASGFSVGGSPTTPNLGFGQSAGAPQPQPTYTSIDPSLPTPQYGTGFNPNLAPPMQPGGGGVMIQQPGGGEIPYGQVTPAPPSSQPAQQPGPAAQAGPAVLASSQGYNANNVDLANQYQQMGMSDPGQANARLLSGQVNNPYLDAQADNITKRLNRNLQENVLPGIGQGATMAGQYGGSRQGIAQGKAIGDTQDNLANSLTNMYGSANEAAQNRMSTAASNLSGIGAQVGMANAGFQNQASQFGANAANQASLANASAQNQNNQFNAGQSNAYGIANMGNQTTQRGQDQSFTLGQMNNSTNQRGQDINQSIANMGNATTQRGQDQSYALGQMGNQTTQRGQDQSYALGSASNANQANSIANSYNLGLGQNANQATANNNNFTLGQMNNNTTQRGQDLNQQVASGNLSLGWQQAGNAYNLGLGNLNLGQQQANNSYNLGQGQLAVTNQGQNQNFYSTQRGQDLQQYQLGANLYSNGVNGQLGVGQGQYGVGQQYMNAPMNAINQYGQAISPYTGYGQTQTTSGQSGGGANGVVGGGLAGLQIANNLWRSNQGANQYNQNMGVNFTAPGVYG